MVMISHSHAIVTDACKAEKVLGSIPSETNFYGFLAFLPRSSKYQKLGHGHGKQFPETPLDSA